MTDAAPSYASLQPSIVRRAAPAEAQPVGEAVDAAGWRDDLRLFLFTYAAGFVFFLAFLA